MNKTRMEEVIAATMQKVKFQHQESKGLGDTIANITKAVGIKPCNGCKKRQEKLNKMFPYEAKN